jgi:glucokinase
MGSHGEQGAVIGVDIGGTKVASGIVDVHGQILAQFRLPMVAGEDAGAGFMAVCRAVDSMMVHAADLKCKIGGIGICSPGPLILRPGLL